MDAEALLTRAQDAHRAGRIDEAEATYAQVIDAPTAAPGHRADAHYGLGTVHLQRGALPGALAALDAALALDGQVPEYHFNRALVLERLRDRATAIAAFTRAAQVADANGDGEVVLQPAVEGLLRLHAWREVLVLLEHRSDSALDGARARALAGAGDWAGARLLARRLTDANPQDAQRWQLRAQAAAALRDYDEAIAAKERYLSLCHPVQASDLLAYADLLLTARRPAKAREALDRARTLGARDPEYASVDAHLARIEGNLEHALMSARRVLQVRSDHGPAWQLVAELCPQGELAQAVDALGALEDARVDATSGAQAVQRLFAYARLLERQGSLDLAWAAMRRANDAQRDSLVARGAAYDAERQRAVDVMRLQRVPASAPDATGEAEDDAQPRVLFILGMPRSGTTLVERIVGGLPGVHMGGENEAMAFIAASEEHRHARAQGAPIGALDHDRRVALRKDYFARSLPQAPGEIVLLTDKMPHNVHHVGLIADIFGGLARIVWMRRHPLDVCLSIYSRRFPDGHRYACELEGLAHYYAHTESLRRAWQERVGQRILDISYEALVSEPEVHGKEIAAHAGLPWDGASLDITEREGAAFTFSELQVREPINARGIGRHRAWGALLDPLANALRSHGVEC